MKAPPRKKERVEHIRNPVEKSSAGRSELPRSREIKLATEGTDKNEIGKKGGYR